MDRKQVLESVISSLHSRFRESLLGGLTRQLLDRPALPLLLAH